MTTHTADCKIAATDVLSPKGCCPRCDEIRKEERNRARRERHAILTDLGLKRVKGSLGGVYYE